jgi:hypothetical protein
MCINPNRDPTPNSSDHKYIPVDSNVTFIKEIDIIGGITKVKK